MFLQSGYADWATYLFLTTASLEALNKHLKKPLTMKSFRPNIVIDGTDAFEEVYMSYVYICLQ
jgi:uncharacterized protein YcbX